MGIVTHLGVVYPWLCDSMGHMNTQHYAAMYDAATFHFINALAPQQALADSGRGWADIKQTIEYKHEARSGGLVTIVTSLLRVGGKSVTFLHEMRNSDSQEIHSTCENVTVLFDLKARKAIPLDDAIRAAAERLGVAS